MANVEQLKQISNVLDAIHMKAGNIEALMTDVYWNKKSLTKTETDQVLSSLISINNRLTKIQRKLS